MPAYVKDAGVWKEATVYVRGGGVWKLASPSVRDGGTWKAVAPAVTFLPDGGASSGAPAYLSAEDFWPMEATITISCSATATWTWSSTGSGTLNSSVASGGSATSIQFTLTGQSGLIRQRTITLSGTANGVTKYYSIVLSVDGS